jgi:hypothetical protein
MVNETEKILHRNTINPDHYKKGGLEVVEVMEAFFTSGKSCDTHLSQSFKYSSRAGDKPYPGKTIEESYLIDLQKAKWWLDRAIARLEAIYDD